MIMERKKILVIGPSPERSKGGMATVIQGIRDDYSLKEKFDIDIFDSYIDGNKINRALYTINAFHKFKTKYMAYDLFHIHVASYGSTFRKVKYVRFIKKHHKKVILHIHGAAYMDFYNKLNDEKKRYVVDTLKSCDLVIALSNEWKERFEKNLGLENCVSLPNGIDTNEFERAIIEDGAFINSFLLLGRLGKRKGAYDLVDAVDLLVKDFPSIKLYMAGDGEIDQVKEIVKKKKLEKNIEIVGWVDFQGKIKLMKKVATIVLPSYNEGLPMTILEGMAAGKAIISSTVGAIPEVVKDDNGILIAPGDIESLSNAMKKMMNTPGLPGTMGRSNIKKINENFSMKKMHSDFAQFYESVCT
jgi:glycosyltransferase involved in cell wall biosynthesis